MRNGDESFAAHLRGLIEEVDPAPEPPRDVIWARIEGVRRSHARTAPPAPAGWLPWGVALAATLVLGIGIGRAVPSWRATAPTVVARPDGSAGDAAAPAGPYRLATIQHLDAAEALLTGLPLDARTGGTEQVARWAQDLLTTTRLLQDSPAAHDPQLATLFSDLEFVLAQIALLPPGSDEEELELIQRSIRDNDVLMRVRAVTNQRPAAGI